MPAALAREALARRVPDALGIETMTPSRSKTTASIMVLPGASGRHPLNSYVGMIVATGLDAGQPEAALGIFGACSIQALHRY